ncbi:hypothetical protein WICPIJ_005667 [Wickerhamomyces pijperi]|uniref:Uncharacterized protein n=1 Tax=Wickerhamomyces pijperi TaxID=599730 RepID=A0A9P8TLP6_WICPI|nr:hypothetical protein WICPIJ_005667 [Wickerhamomyces pijperi]
MNPTYVGYIGSTKDALLIIQSTLNNQLAPVGRRPHDRERPSLIKSGNVFVFIEERSGIKRWTDGVAWSPSRILGRFLVYRELDKSSKEEETKTEEPASKRKNSVGSASGSRTSSMTDNRSLVGSLITSYAFKENGLIKKTMSLAVAKSDGSGSLETIHLVSYYSAEDVLSGTLLRPIDSPDVKNVQLSPSLWNAVKDSSLGGKIPIEDESYYLIDSSNPNAIALGFNPNQIPSTVPTTATVTATTLPTKRNSIDQRRVSSSSQSSGNLPQGQMSIPGGYAYLPNLNQGAVHSAGGISGSAGGSISSASSNPEELRYLNQHILGSNSSSISSISSSSSATSYPMVNTSPSQSGSRKMDRVPTVEMDTSNTSTATLTNKVNSPEISPRVAARGEVYPMNASNMIPRYQQQQVVDPNSEMLSSQADLINQQLSYNQSVPMVQYPQMQNISTPISFQTTSNAQQQLQGAFPQYTLQHHSPHAAVSQMPMISTHGIYSIPQQQQQFQRNGGNNCVNASYFDQYTIFPTNTTLQQQQQQQHQQQQQQQQQPVLTTSGPVTPGIHAHHQHQHAGNQNQGHVHNNGGPYATVVYHSNQ